jgi:LacI family transcriptional regulator
VPTVTLDDVARAAGVSTQTVSRVINGKGYVKAETRQMVEAAVRRLGYEQNRVASSLVTGRTLAVGMVVPDISNPFFSEIVLGVETTLSQAGYNVTLCNTGENAEREKNILHFLRKARVDGLILAGARLEQDALLIEISKHQALVSINRPVPAEFGSNVQSDHVRGIELAVDYMLQCGRQNLAFMAGPDKAYAAQERLRGFLQAYKNRIGPINPNTVVPYTANLADRFHTLDEWLQSDKGDTPEWAELRAHFGFHGALSLLQARPDVDGVLCYDDQLAYGVLLACQHLGRRVPDDVAIIGCGDIPLANQVTPALTTQRFARYRMGATAAQLLIERMTTGTAQSEVVFPHELVVRASTPHLQ